MHVFCYLLSLILLMTAPNHTQARKASKSEDIKEERDSTDFFSQETTTKTDSEEKVVFEWDVTYPKLIQEWNEYFRLESRKPTTNWTLDPKASAAGLTEETPQFFKYAATGFFPTLPNSLWRYIKDDKYLSHGYLNKGTSLSDYVNSEYPYPEDTSITAFKRRRLSHGGRMKPSWTTYWEMKLEVPDKAHVFTNFSVFEWNESDDFKYHEMNDKFNQDSKNWLKRKTYEKLSPTNSDYIARSGRDIKPKLPDAIWNAIKNFDNCSEPLTDFEDGVKLSDFISADFTFPEGTVFTGTKRRRLTHPQVGASYFYSYWVLRLEIPQGDEIFTKENLAAKESGSKKAGKTSSGPGSTKTAGQKRGRQIIEEDSAEHEEEKSSESDKSDELDSVFRKLQWNFDGDNKIGNVYGKDITDKSFQALVKRAEVERQRGEPVAKRLRSDSKRPVRSARGGSRSAGNTLPC